MDIHNLIITYSSFKGDWDLFIDTLYHVFERDFIRSMPRFKGHEVDFYDKRKINSNKEECFWHLTSRDYPSRHGGIFIKERKPDIVRAERIAWIREIIECYDDDTVEMWLDKSFPKGSRYHLWYRNEFLVVFEDIKFGYYNLITSFYTNRAKDIEHYNQQLIKWSI